MKGSGRHSGGKHSSPFSGKGPIEKSNTVNSETGTITYSGKSEVVPSNHKGMPTRTDAYELTDERGHIQAASLGGSNARENIVPQSKDLNRGAYAKMERAERGIDKKGGTVESEKTAYVSNQPGGRPDAFIVNDRVVHENGNIQEIHLSFENMTNEEQESINTAVNEKTEMPDAPNPGDILRESMSESEYSQLMEETDPFLPNITEMYDESNIYVESSGTVGPETVEFTISEEMLLDMEEEVPDETIVDFELPDVTDADPEDTDAGESGSDSSDGSDGGDDSDP